MKRAAGIIIGALAIAMAADLAAAHGIIVPVRPEHRVSGLWAVKYHHVKMTIRDQVASVAVDQEFINTSGGMIEVEYMFPVPPDAAIDSMTLVVNGKEYAAQLYKADEARRIYEEIVRTKKDPALLEYVGFGLYRTKAFPLEAGKPARVQVTYKSVCHKDRDLVEAWYPLNTEKFSSRPIEDVEVKVDIKTEADIVSVYSPSHDLKTERKDAKQVIATYSARNTLPTTDFQVFYKAADETIGATLMTHQPDSRKDGYFMLLVSPNSRLAKENVVPKDVVIVFDHSGSMAGGKIDQAKEAIRYVLKNLNRNDRFNVVMYNDSVEPFYDRLVEAYDKKIEDALDRVDRIEASGGTNIAEALDIAMQMLSGGPKKGEREDALVKAATISRQVRPSYVMFMTDGQPTVGKVNTADILESVHKANACDARLFAFGVGYDVNVNLMDKLVEQNSGKSDYVKPKEPIETKISSLYSKIKNPVMTDLAVSISGMKLRDMYPRKLGDLFDGDQLVVVGRYECEDLKKEDGAYHSQLVVKGVYEGNERAFEYPVTIQAPGKAGRYEFTEKLWAIRRVGFLMDQIQLHGQNKEVIDELIRLSKEYGIMTPYTSFLADERTKLADAREQADKLKKDIANDDARGRRSEGKAGQMDAVARQQAKEAYNLAMPATSPSIAGGKPADDAVVMYGNMSGANYEKGEADIVKGVKQVGNQALYRRSNIWFAANAADVDLEKDAKKIQEVQRFSKEYFELVRANTQAENLVLSQQKAEEEVVINLRGQIYRIK